MESSSVIKSDARVRILSLRFEGVAEGKSLLLWNEAKVVKVSVNVEFEAGTGCTFSCPLKQSRLRDSNDPGSSGEVVVPRAPDHVRLLFIPASYPGWIFEPLCHARKMAGFVRRVKSEMVNGSAVNMRFSEPKDEGTCAPETAPENEVYSEPSATRRNHDSPEAGPDGTYAYRNQADGCFE